MNIDTEFPLKRVLVTGGASGLGKSIARRFAARGWKVALTDLHGPRIAQTMAELAPLAAKTLSFEADVSDEQAWRRVESRIVEDWGGLDILVNNAGIGVGGHFEQVPLPQWEKILRVNLQGPIIGSHVFVPHFIKQGGGHIVNVASSAGIASLPEMTPYNVTKSALLSFSESLRMELAKHKIGVTCLAPTYFRSNLGETSFTADAAQRPRGNAVAQAKFSADDITDDLMDAMETGRFYVITQADGRFIWRFKRLMPERYLKAITWAYDRNLLARFS